MIMKTKHVNNTGRIVRRGKMGKLPEEAKQANCQGEKRGTLPGGKQIAQGGWALPLLPLSYSLPVGPILRYIFLFYMLK